MREPDLAQRAYRSLLMLYPLEFRQRLGPSMEQTFADSLHSRQRSRSHALAFVGWAFLETSIGIIKERARHTKRISLGAGVAAFAIMLPFMVLEWTTATAEPRSRFAFVLFVYLWLLAMLFIRTSIGAARTAFSMRAAQIVVTKSVWLVSRVAFLVWVGWTWLSFMNDQMPCFRGATGC